MNVLDIVAAVLMLTGLVFFSAGTAGLLRFSDTFGRMHALTKADNVGLGLLVTGLALIDGSVRGAVELMLIWLLVMFSGATACYLIANRLTREMHDGRD